MLAVASSELEEVKLKAESTLALDGKIAKDKKTAVAIVAVLKFMQRRGQTPSNGVGRRYRSIVGFRGECTTAKEVGAYISCSLSVQAHNLANHVILVSNSCFLLCRKFCDWSLSHLS